jgi:DNA modification methylase
MTVRVLPGDCRTVLAALPAKSVHVAVTSPPYWQLRAYGTPPQTWGDGWVCELGQEWSLDAFIGHLVEVFAAVGRVLRDDGTLWVNIADTYFSNPGGQNGEGGTLSEKAKDARRTQGRIDRTGTEQGLKAGDLCMAPARFALAMQAAGWTLRSQIVLPKKAPMPESLQSSRWERCRVKAGAGAKDALSGAEANAHRGPSGAQGQRGHGGETGQAEWADCPGCPKCDHPDPEQRGYVQRWGSWRPTSAVEYLYLFSKAGQRYFADGEAVRLPVSAATLADGRMARGQRGTKGEYGTVDGNAGYNPAGRNLWNYVMWGDPEPPRLREDLTDEQRADIFKRISDLRSDLLEYFEVGEPASFPDYVVWSPEPLAAAHYAAFPRFIPRLAIQAGTSEAGVCPTCGAPWLRCIERRGIEAPRDGIDRKANRGVGRTGTGIDRTLPPNEHSESTTLGWRPSCRCAAHSPVPATCLDPFSGSGTTLIEANALGRHGIGIELQGKYVDISHQRLRGQPLSLFAHEAAE